MTTTHTDPLDPRGRAPRTTARLRMRAIVAAAAVAFLAAPRGAGAQPPPAPGQPVAARSGDWDDRTPPRLGFMHGQVSFWRTGAEDWSQAQTNMPLAPGDAVYGGRDASFEIQIGPRAFVRGGSETQLVLSNHEREFMQFTITAGHAALDLRDLERGMMIEIDAPNAAFRVDTPGYYRVDVTDTTTTFVARRGGSATVIAAGGESTGVDSGEQILVEGTEYARLQTYAAAELDAWDQWNYDRIEGLNQSVSRRYVPEGVYGAEDLDHYGTWRETQDYGNVWVPSGVAADWSPYSDGRWVWDPYYGWSWVDYSPWGWAPHHYGRWVHFSGYWGWAPGPIVAAPVYSPAVVAFFGGGGFGVSVGIGVPAVSWVALGWGEPIIPWWGHHHDHGYASWRGWGGPRYVNNTIINNNTVINVNNINVYRNTDVRNAVLAAREDRFGRGRGDHLRLASTDLRRLKPIRGQVPVRPVRASLTPREGRGTRPPDRVLRRSVVATRKPRDIAPSLRAQGIDVSSKRGVDPRVESRIVTDPGRRASRGDRDLRGRELRGREEQLRRSNEAAVERRAPGDRRREAAERANRPNANPPNATDSRPDPSQRGRDARSVPSTTDERRRVRERAAQRPAPPSQVRERREAPQQGQPAAPRERRDVARPEPPHRDAPRSAPRGEVGRRSEPSRKQLTQPEAPRREAPRVEQQRREAPRAAEQPRGETMRQETIRGRSRPAPERREAVRQQRAPRREAVRQEAPRREAARPQPQPRREVARPEPRQREMREPARRAGDAPANVERRAPRERVREAPRSSGGGRAPAQDQSRGQGRDKGH